MSSERSISSAIRGSLSRAGANFRRYQLAWIAGPALIGLLVLTALSIYQLSTISIDKVRSYRTQLFQRDLQSIAGRLDTDERLVLNSNVTELLAESRELRPLLLPRQYYIKLPPGWSRTVPRAPPRNCFVQLRPRTVLPNADVQACAYFIENRDAGDFLFLNVSMKDDGIAPLRLGDVDLTADGVQVQIRLGSRVVKWWLLLQRPRDPNRNRYELTAFRILSPTLHERDRKVEGWAYAVKTQKGVINLLSRIDMRDFRTLAQADEWPPSGWRQMQVSIVRRNATPDYQSVGDVAYGTQGIAQLSLASLAAPIFEAHGSVTVHHPLETANKQIRIPPGASLQFSADDGSRFLRVEDGDLIVRSHPLITSLTVPDTDVTLAARHPGTVIQKEVWVTALFLGAMFLAGAGATVYFFFALLLPIGRLSTSAEAAVDEPSASAHSLPYRDKHNELGTLARAFEELLEATKKRAAQQARAREENVRIIGHEILSPLQSLMNTVQQEHPARRYVERMVAAVHALFGSSGTAGFQGRQLHLEDVDLAAYLHGASEHEWGGTVDDVQFEGPASGLLCRVDPDALEDALTNILNNAQRYRTAGTPIHVRLSADARSVTVQIANFGQPVRPDILPVAFEWKVSEATSGRGSNQGIGLWVARHYIEQMGGVISIDNTAEGVEVRIVLSLIRKHSARVGKA
jgi:signal transduction histidine kinase